MSRHSSFEVRHTWVTTGVAHALTAPIIFFIKWEDSSPYLAEFL